MAKSAAVTALEAETPWTRPSFRYGLSSLTASTMTASRMFAADARTLARLAAQVPRCPGDETGGTPWTSFRAEVAVARRVSEQAAAAEIRNALRLTSVLPHTLDLLLGGQITVARARAFVDELEVYDDEIAAQLDCDLALDVARLSVARIKETVRRAALALDPDSAALRKARQTAQRNVAFWPLDDGQAAVVLTGPATPLTRWHSTLDQRARALRAAGDPRNLDALRFDLATSTFPCTTHGPAAPDDPSDPSATADASSTPAPRTTPPTPTPRTDDTPPVDDTAPAGLRLSGVEAAASDCRMSRPVQAMIVVPVETALGLANDPAWLDGYGWIDAPTSRTLLVDAELRQVCADRTTGQVVDLAPRDLRPPPSARGVRQTLLEIIGAELTVTDTAWRAEPQHDPSAPLRQLTALRDRTCDGPTQTRTRAGICDQDHDRPYPHGPTAAWNLVSRNRRTHQLKHYGWTPVRTATSTIWTSPAGQLVEVPRQHTPPPGIDPDPRGRPPELPDPDELAATDAHQLTPPDEHDNPPCLPPGAAEPIRWTILDGSEEPPF